VSPANVAELDGSKFNITRSTNLRDVPLPGSPEELSHFSLNVGEERFCESLTVNG
jgi:hypothetical protein